MTGRVTIIGYGEAGRTFARAADWRGSASAFDVRPRAADYAADGINGCATLGKALSGTPNVISVVTADQALVAARAAAEHIAANALYFDMNSVAPETKRRAAAAIEAATARYVDVAIMAPVDPAGLAAPLLVCGPHAVAGAAALTDLGFESVRVIAGAVGRASAIKMIRSVMIKGQEALTAEMMLAAAAADITDEVLMSLGEGWRATAAYRLERMATHGMRRAAEMTEAALTLESLGIDPVMTRGTIIRQREMAR
jgi:3-hydroxyisobutyrate dehydrogenase-like beta-hydroxyacid dehydrogenase